MLFTLLFNACNLEFEFGPNTIMIQNNEIDKNVDKKDKKNNYC